MMRDWMDAAISLALERKKIGLSIKEVSRAMGCSQEKIKQWEDGKGDPREYILWLNRMRKG